MDHRRSPRSTAAEMIADRRARVITGCGDPQSGDQG
jgi:hypothetical protein